MDKKLTVGKLREAIALDHIIMNSG